MEIKDLIKYYNFGITLVNRKVFIKQLLDMSIEELEEIGELVGIEMSKQIANPLIKRNENKVENDLNIFLEILKSIYNAKVDLEEEKKRKKELEEEIKKVKEILEEKEEKKLMKAKKTELEKRLNFLLNELNKLQ